MADASFEALHIDSEGESFMLDVDFGSDVLADVQGQGDIAAGKAGTLSSGQTLTPEHVKFENIGGNTKGFISGAVSPRLPSSAQRPNADFDAGLLTGAANGHSTAGISGETCINHSCVDADGVFNLTSPISGCPPYSNVSPSSAGSGPLYDLNANSIEANGDDGGNGDGASITTWTNDGSAGSDGAANGTATYEKDRFGAGLHAVEADNAGVTSWSGVDLSSQSVTMIAVAEFTEADVGAGRTFDWNSEGVKQSHGKAHVNVSGQTTNSVWTNNTDQISVGERGVYALRWDQSTSTLEGFWLGGLTGREPSASVASASADIKHGTGFISKMSWGRILIYNSALSDDDLYGVIGRLMEDYGLAPREIHVTSAGDDSTGDGSAGSPYATVHKAAEAARPNVGEHVVMEAGSSLSDGSSNPGVVASGFSPERPTVHRVGTGRATSGRAVLNPSSETSRGWNLTEHVMGAGEVTHVVIQGLRVHNTHRDPDHADYIGDASVGAGSEGFRVVADGDDLRFFDCACEFVKDGWVFTANSGTNLRRVMVARPSGWKVYHGASDTGSSRANLIYADGVRDLAITKPTGYQCGHNSDISTAEKNIFSHMLYLQYSCRGHCVVRSPLSLDTAANAMQVRHGGWVEDAVCWDTPIGVLSARWETLISRVLFHGGSDVAGGSTPGPRGFAVDCQSCDRIKVRDAIAYGEGYDASGNAIGFWIQDEQGTGGTDGAGQHDVGTYRLDIERVTIKNVDGSGLKLTTSDLPESMRLVRAIVQSDDADDYLINGGSFTPAALNASFGTAEHNVYQSPSSTPHRNDSTDHSITDMAADIGETSPTDKEVEFNAELGVDDWYEQAMGGSTLTSAALAAEIRAAADKGQQSDYFASAIYAWAVANGWSPTNLDAADYGGTLPGAIASAAPAAPSTGTRARRPRRRRPLWR